MARRMAVVYKQWAKAMLKRPTRRGRVRTLTSKTDKSPAHVPTSRVCVWTRFPESAANLDYGTGRGVENSLWRSGFWACVRLGGPNNPRTGYPQRTILFGLKGKQGSPPFLGRFFPPLVLEGNTQPRPFWGEGGGVPFLQAHLSHNENLAQTW